MKLNLPRPLSDEVLLPKLAGNPAGRLLLLVVVGGYTVKAVQQLGVAVKIARALEEHPPASFADVWRHARAQRDASRRAAAEHDSSLDDDDDASRVAGRPVDEPPAAPAG